VVVVRRTVGVVRGGHHQTVRTDAAGLGLAASAWDIAHSPPPSASTATVPKPTRRRSARLVMDAASARRDRPL
jgi:hypothetical protein